MDERDDSPVTGRSAERLLLIAEGGVLAVTSPIWLPSAVILFLDSAGDDGPRWLLAAAYLSAAALTVWIVVRLINRRERGRLKLPPHTA